MKTLRLLALWMLLSGSPVWAQTISQPSGNAPSASPTFTGTVTMPDSTTWTASGQTAPTDIVRVYSAVIFCRSDNALFINTRVASNDWALARTAGGAETYNIRCELPAPTRTTSGKGYKLTAFSVSHFIGTAALTSNTFNALSTTTYANNVANAVAAYGGAITITLPTATQGNPYLTSGGVGTPAFMNTANASVGMDFTAVMQNTGVYRLYGISATWTQQP
jgi:hypothetical protein